MVISVAPVTYPTVEQVSQRLAGLSQTSLLPLYIRAQETLRGDRILKDLPAVAMMRSLKLSFPSESVSPISQLAHILATRLFDYAVMHFLEASPGGIVINLGAGLCSRFQRLDNQQVTWYDIDFPEVNQIRAEFFEASDRYRWISQSFLDLRWLEYIQASPEQPVLILMEGVSPFLQTVELQELLTAIKQRFQSVEILMDVVCLENIWHRQSCQILSDPPLKLTWGIKDSQTLERWGLGIKILEENYYLSYLKHFSSRIPTWNRAWMMSSIPLIKNANRLLRIGFQERCPP